jgi:hypothetical protein
MDNNLQAKPARALDSLSLMPSNIKFANQNQDENVVLFIRQHKIILLGYFILFIVRLILPFVLYTLILWFTNLSFIKNLNLDFKIRDIYIIAAFIVWFLWSFTQFFADFLYWYYNGYIITSQRLLDLDFISVLKHSIKELDLRKIEDAVDTHNGIMQTIFDMGTIVIRTASEQTTFLLDNVPRSSNIRDFVMDMSIYNSSNNPTS